jgi:murein L,D-transpeptidase YcbB/YkuD
MLVVRNDRGGYDRIIAAAVAAFVVMGASQASAQANPATTPSELAIDAAVPMPDFANVPPPSRADLPPSPTDFKNLARGLATGEPAAEPKPAAETPAVAAAPAATPAAPTPAPATTATAPAKDDVKADETRKDDVAAKPPVPAAPATVAPATEPAKAQASTVAATDQPVADKIKDLLTVRGSRIFDRKDERVAAEAFYKERSYAPIWIDNGAASARGKAAAARLKAADGDGLNASDYPLPDFAAATTPDALAEAELKLTASVLDYARHAQGGRMHYSRVSADIFYPEHNPEAADVLSSMATTKDAAAALDSYNPQHKGYKALKAKLAELRGTSETAPPKIDEGPALKFVKNAKNAKKPVPVMDDPRVPQLRARLGVSENADSTQYDETVANAVRKFQSDADLKATGVLDNQTLRAMNSPKRGRTIDLILANMERWRWLPRQLGEPKLGNAYVMLNIPDFTLRVMHNGAQAWTTRVVTGKPGKQATPELTETMKFITVNPTWNVPPSIVYNEYLPALQQDPTVLERMGLRLSQNRDGSVHISQPPGAGNALGRIRFNFPNKFLVYQHDTPDKHLFAHDTRAYSHGCMRVQNPDMYAETLLGIALPKENYSAARIRSMYGNSEIDIKFPTPIPVHIVYHTAFVDDAGHLQTRKDVYGRDSRLLEVLRSGDRQNMEMAVNHAKPNYARPSTTLPPGVVGANSYSSGSSGRGFFETLFGVQPAPPPPQQQRPRRAQERQASR